MKPIMIVGTSAVGRQKLAVKYFEDTFQLIFMSPNINEKNYRSSCPETLTKLIAEAKMDKIRQLVEDDEKLRHSIRAHPLSVAVTFDQVVVWAGEIREKAVSEAECRAFIRSYSNSSVGTVETTSVYHFALQKMASASNRTMTYYREIPDDAIERIIARGACKRSAGALIIEDEDMKARMIKIDPGDEEAVQGMCVQVVRELLKQF
ncbi:unnamed protein product [Phytomonas sp. Hart1]|nr:unnamed protein product [Phytomonas sp. Hart1]|eukprot:CCW70600.1 unnamed protein product [Phytomonas sp. isolate Hart1]